MRHSDLRSVDSQVDEEPSGASGMVDGKRELGVERRAERMDEGECMTEKMPTEHPAEPQLDPAEPSSLVDPYAPYVLRPARPTTYLSQALGITHYRVGLDARCWRLSGLPTYSVSSIHPSQRHMPHQSSALVCCSFGQPTSSHPEPGERAWRASAAAAAVVGKLHSLT